MLKIPKNPKYPGKTGNSKKFLVLSSTPLKTEKNPRLQGIIPAVGILAASIDVLG